MTFSSFVTDSCTEARSIDTVKHYKRFLGKVSESVQRKKTFIVSSQSKYLK